MDWSLTARRSADALGSAGSNIVSFDPTTRSARRDTIRASAIVFKDPASLRLQADLDRIAPRDVTLLVIGETGTGKELASRYIHDHSARRAGPFVAVNCGAFTDSLAEAELFGYEKGAFTGALRTQPGWFEAAQGGTLLLDEVGDLPMSLQVKLLRVLQEREVVRVGSRTPIPIDLRLIAATNVDLEAAVAAKRFREDLYFRLNVATLRLPPLRERRGDIAPLAQYFLELYRERLERPELRLTAEALRRLAAYPWPGNIRQLENFIHNAVLLAAGPEITADDVQLRCPLRAAEPEAWSLDAAARALVERAVAQGEPEIFDRLSRLAVRAAYDLADGNQVRAAELLGLSRNAIRTQLAHLGTIPPRKKRGAGAEADR